MYEFKNKMDYVGNLAYTNVSIGSGKDVCYGVHGITTVLYAPSVYNSAISYDGIVHTHLNDNYHLNRCSTLFCNIKQQVSQYGGNTYNNRVNSVYMSTGCYKNRSQENSDTCYCFGGDTFLGVLDYAHTLAIASNSYKDKDKYVAAWIPLESSINVYLRHEQHFAQLSEGNAYDKTVTAPVYYRTEPGQLHDWQIQQEPMYTYNSVYSLSDSAKKYVQESLYSVNDINYSNRIVTSELKTNGESIDSWTQFRFLNYLDVDNTYGQITNLYKFRDRLFFFQNDALGVASVNERSLITDNNQSQLTLGTATILSRYDYACTDNGSSVINDRSIVNSKSTLYWYDSNKNVICAYNNSFME